MVCPGAVVLRPCDTLEDGLVFVCPGAVVLRPCDTAARPGADELRPREPITDPGACRPALPTLAANTLADTAGRRSEAEGCRDCGSFASAGGPCEGRRTCANGIPATGIKPSPPSTIANSQPRNNKNTQRPARRSHRARLPVGSSRTADPPPPTFLPMPISTALRAPILEALDRPARVPARSARPQWQPWQPYRRHISST
jgi:hypothetical protein